MPLSTSPRQSDAALLVADAQTGIVGRVPGHEVVLDRIHAALVLARARQVPVIHAVIEFRPGYPEVPDRHPLLDGTRDRGALVAGDRATAPHPTVAPAIGEIVIAKRRVDSFAGTELATVLRARGVRSLALAGFTTSGVILATALAAADRDLQVTVLVDACADPDPALHEALCERLFPRLPRRGASTVTDWAATTATRIDDAR